MTYTFQFTARIFSFGMRAFLMFLRFAPKIASELNKLFQRNMVKHYALYFIATGDSYATVTVPITFFEITEK